MVPAVGGGSSVADSEGCNGGGVGAQEVAITSPSVVADVQDQNLRFKHRIEIFNIDYFNFMLIIGTRNANTLKNQTVALTANPSPPSVGGDAAVDAMTKLGYATLTMSSRFFLDYVLRMEDSVRGPLDGWLHYYVTMFDAWPQSAVLLLNMLDDAEINFQLFFQCANEHVRNIYMTLLMQIIKVMRKVNGVEQSTHRIETFFSKNLIPLLSKQELFHWWKNVSTLFQVFTHYARMDPRNRAFLHAEKTTERCTGIMNSIARSQTNSLALPQGRALSEFISTMLRCVALPTFSEWNDHGFASLNLALARRNPYFEESNMEEDVANDVLEPTQTLMDLLIKGKYFSAGIQFPMSTAFRNLIKYLAFRDIDVSRVVVNQLMEVCIQQ